MGGSAVLDTVVGLAFVFFAVAALSSVVVEWWATVQRKRAKFLLRGLQAMLVEDRGSQPRWWSPAGIGGVLRAEHRLYRAVLTPTVGDGVDHDLVRVMAHPLLRAHRQTDPDGRYTRLPAYLPATEVATALVDVLLDEPTTAQIPVRIDALDTRAVRRSLAALWERADGDRDRFVAGIAGWYDSQMQRVSGWYKRWSKRWLVVVGAVIAIVFGIDTLRIGQALYTDPVVRAAVSAAAADADPALCAISDDDATTSQVSDCTRRVLDEIGSSGLPIGWPTGCPLSLGSCLADRDADPATRPGPAEAIALLLGLALTTLAASAGAPFWYDVLNRFSPLRNNGARPATGDPAPRT